MAHKVLSKDMAELVSALKLAERYSTTTLDNEYRKYETKLRIYQRIILNSFSHIKNRGMLSAAHILAMNAKNLLDVVDHVRIKHPNVNVLFSATGWTESRLA